MRENKKKSAFWDALLRNTDPTKRLYLTPSMDNILEDEDEEIIESVPKEIFLTFEEM